MPQIAVCEEELGRALALASEFRRKVEEDERVKARLEQELAAQRKACREAEARELVVNRNRFFAETPKAETTYFQKLNRN